MNYTPPCVPKGDMKSYQIEKHENINRKPHSSHMPGNIKQSPPCKSENINTPCANRNPILMCLLDVKDLFADCCHCLCRGFKRVGKFEPNILLKLLALALSCSATFIMNQQFYLYFNRVGDVFTMIALGGGLLSSSVLTAMYFLKTPCIEGEKLLLLVYGVLNSVIGVLLILENLYYAMSKSYLTLALLTKCSGIVMLFDFASSPHCEKKKVQPGRCKK